MYSPSRWVRFAVLAVSAVALTRCASTDIHSYLERGADLGRYHTYAWGRADAMSTGDPRLDGNPFFEERLQFRRQQLNGAPHDQGVINNQ